MLCLLGFAATGFVITITLSAADAAAHLIQNPLAPAWLDHPLLLTIALLLILGAVFLKGFQEAITLAVGIVVVYIVAEHRRASPPPSRASGSSRR